MTRKEVLDAMQHAMAGLEQLPPRVSVELLETQRGWIEILYEPHPLLLTRLQEYFEWRAGNREEAAGNLMEEIAYLLFCGLTGAENVRSFQSYAPQHDLVIDGSAQAWQILMMYLHLPRDGRTIVVEAKNQNDRISDQQFSRLCGLLQNKFADTSHLGVFVSRTTASGFPQPPPEEDAVRERSLRDCRATQAVFHAKTGKYVVVVDEYDLRMILEDPFRLTKILEAKVREVETAAGLSLSFDENWNEVDLPPHLSKYR